MVFKTSLCNVICHSIFITMPTGRSLLFPLIGKLKTKTEKKPYLFTSCFHSGGEQEKLWVYYLASLHSQLASSGAVSHTNVYSAWLGNASEACLQVSPLLANLPKAGFNPLLSQGFCLLLYVPITLALLFLLILFFSSSSWGMSVVRLSQVQPCYIDLTHERHSLPRIAALPLPTRKVWQLLL